MISEPGTPDETLEFELLSGAGDGVASGEEIVVTSFPPATVQRGSLRRVP